MLRFGPSLGVCFFHVLIFGSLRGQKSALFLKIGQARRIGLPTRATIIKDWADCLLLQISFCFSVRSSEPVQ